MPTITDHLQAAREHTTQADEQPRHRYNEFVGHLLCAIENLTAAVDQLQQEVNALRQRPALSIKLGGNHHDHH